MSPAGFRRVGGRVVHQGFLIAVEEGEFEAPGGERFGRDVVRHPGAVSVVPLLDDGTVVLVRQYRAAIDGELLEIPAGKRDVAGEPPEVTAARELGEEVGYAAGRLDKLAEFYNSPGFCDERSHVFLGRDLTPVAASAQGHEESHMTVEHVALADVPRLVASGAVTDAKTIIGCMLALERLRTERA